LIPIIIDVDIEKERKRMEEEEILKAVEEFTPLQSVALRAKGIQFTGKNIHYG
jgi:hypothetical protein